ncbi:MAG: CapA family protein [Clostridia bacterium]|nr:CapA family protein [Clostridia bacterium]
MRKQKRFDMMLLTVSVIIAVMAVIAVSVRYASKGSPGGDIYTEAGVITDTVITTELLVATEAPVTEPVETDEVTEHVTDPPVTTELVTEPATEPVTEAPEASEDKIISVLACGDNLLYRPNTFEADELSIDGKRSYMFTYESIAEFLGSADISFINQETLLCGGNSGYPLFNSPFEVADTLSELGFDVANIATNHMLDVGYDGALNSTGEGIEISRYTLENAGLTVIGGYLNEDDFNNVRILERDGVRIAFLAFTESTNTITLYDNSEIYIPYLTEENVIAAVSAARKVADVIIVSAHWGVDSSSRLSDSQLYFAKLFADLGVDAVIGHHSHIVHPIEWIEGKDGNRMLCAYSLGNLIGIMEYPLTVLGGILTFDIRVADGEKPVVENVGFVPTVYNYDKHYRNNKIYFLEDYTDEMAAEHGVCKVYDHEFTVDDLTDHIKNTVNEVFIRSINDYR